MPVKLDPKALEILGRAISPPPPPPAKKKTKDDDDEYWAPSLEKTQKRIFNCKRRYVLAYGEKGSGKTIGLLHKVARHCYENRNALGLILVRVRAMATHGGAWDKLIHHILPRWKEGLGIEYSEVKFDAQHNEYIWVENKYGEWSQIVLISAPHAHQLRERIRGYEPSIVLVDELTSCDSVEYLRAVAAQVGRRENIETEQQYLAACNPEGPSHWVYKVWWEEAFDPVTGEWDPDYAKFHVPIRENIKNLPKGYVENLEKLYRSDPVEAARMLRGEWIDRPTGQSLFFDVFIPALHVKPEPGSRQRIIPNPEFPLIIGIDPGSANNAFVFEQWYPVEGALKWIVFDEVVFTQRRIRYDVLIPIVLRRIKFWNDHCKTKFRVAYNSDNSAFNQFRPGGGGSYDVLEFERIANTRSAETGKSLAETLGVGRMKVTDAPKFSGSRATRVRLTMDLLSQEKLLISSGCPRTLEMFHKLESEAGDPKDTGSKYDPELALTPKRSPHLHVFDAMSYPILTGSLKPNQLTPPPESGTQKMVSIGA